jgi:PKD repeat protein
VSEGLPVLEWIWNFGDGSNSTEQAPTHVYEQAGSYTVTLIVRTAAGSSDPMVKSAYISVLPQVEGEVDLSELAGELLDSFSSLDTNNDSALSPDELRAAEHSVSDATFDRLDLNHDGAISQTELAGFVVEGEVPEGETVDGEIPMEGEPAEGQPAEGSAVEGQPADGEPPAEGEPGEGTAPEGETPGEGEPEPQRTEGEPADISAQSAFSCTGITG